MKPFYKDLTVACLLGLLLPGMLLCFGVAIWGKEPQKPEPTVTEINRDQAKVLVLIDEEVVELGLEDYLTGVILAEMPASFEFEARKAQAVVARTYTVRAMEGKSKHENAAVCTDSSCCQGYISPQDYLSEGGTQDSVDSMRMAVRDTENLILTYEGEVIEATYFSCSGGSTEDAVAVWGTDFPYLRATDSPGEEYAVHFSDTTFWNQSAWAKTASHGLIDSYALFTSKTIFAA